MLYLEEEDGKSWQKWLQAAFVNEAETLKLTPNGEDLESLWVK